MNAHGRRIYRRQQARVATVAILSFVRANALRILQRVKERIACAIADLTARLSVLALGDGSDSAWRVSKSPADMLKVAVQKLPTYYAGSTIEKIRRLG